MSSNIASMFRVTMTVDDSRGSVMTEGYHGYASIAYPGVLSVTRPRFAGCYPIGLPFRFRPLSHPI